MAAWKRMVQLGAHSRLCLTNIKGFSNYSSSSSVVDSFRYRHISQVVKPNGKRPVLVDTLALVRSLEGQGVPSNQADAITYAIIEVLNDSLGSVSQSFVSNAEMQKEKLKCEIEEKLKCEIEEKLEKLKCEIEEKLKCEIEKMRSELRYEIDKVIARQLLDLNLEKGRICDELANLYAEIKKLRNKLDREIHALGARLEATKYDVIKYCITTTVSIFAAGLAIIQILF